MKTTVACATAWLVTFAATATATASALTGQAGAAAKTTAAAQPTGALHPAPSQFAAAPSARALTPLPPPVSIKSEPVGQTAPTAQTTAPTLQGAQTLAALFGIACKYDAPYRAALAQVRASEAAVGQARATLLPRVGLQADLQGSRLNGSSKEPIQVAPGIFGSSVGKSYSQNDVGLNATQPLYRPASKIAWDQSKLQFDIARVQLAAAQQDLIVRLAQTYFDVLAAQDTLRYLGTLKDSVNQQLAMAQRNFEIGNANVTDSREAQARLALTSAQEIAATNDLHVKQLALDQLVGHSGIQPLLLADPVDLPAPAPQDADVWVLRAANAPAVRQAHLAMGIMQLEMDKAKTGHLPALDLQATVAHAQYPSGNPMGSISPLTGYQTTLGTVGLQMTWLLYGGGVVLERQHEVLALKDKAQAELDNALRGSAQAARTAYFTLQSVLEQVKALQAAQNASHAALQANELGYRVGARTNIDVLNAQSQLFETERDLARARYDVLIGLLRLKQTAGTLSQNDLARIDGLLAR